MKFAKQGIDYHDVEAKGANPGNVRPLAEGLRHVPWG
jgi:hypothetical protein